MIRSKSIGFSGSQFRFVVEVFNNTTGELAFGPKPVQQQGAVLPQVNKALADYQQYYNHYRPHDGVDLATLISYYQKPMQAA